MELLSVGDESFKQVVAPFDGVVTARETDIGALGEQHFARQFRARKAGRVADSLRAGSSTAGLKTLSEIIGFDGKWELDIFGKYRRLLEAARDDTEALAELRNAVTDNGHRRCGAQLYQHSRV